MPTAESLNPADLPIREAAARLRAGSLSAGELLQAHLQRIDTIDPAINAFIYVMREQAIAAALQAERDFSAGHDRGLMQGIPFAIKDVFDTAGVPTTCGSRRLARHLPLQDAEVVAFLKAAGAVPLGKLATYEFALAGPSFDLPHPPARNPWNTDHITGGSSSGSAAAVAAGLVRVALGTDSGGSVRSPASYCGVVGLKPGYAALPMQGVYPLAPSLDHVGVLGATVEDAAICLDVMAGQGIGACADLQRNIDGLRIGYARNWFAQDANLDPGVLEQLDAAASRLSLAGARIELVELSDYSPLETAGAAIMHAEVWLQHGQAWQADAESFSRPAGDSIAAGLSVSTTELAQARTLAILFTDELDTKVFNHCDALITACTLTTAPPFSDFVSGRMRWTPMRTLPFNLSGHPALCCPIGYLHGLPLGIQIIGRMGDEAGICRIAAALERVSDCGAVNP
jgi:aspartyl-tRNA(Asn)/glutamyl-tRNA(Gln) amidotransferase subunit A